MPGVHIGLSAVGECPTTASQPHEDPGGLVDLLMTCLLDWRGTQRTALGSRTEPPEHMPGRELLQQADVVGMLDTRQALAEPALEEQDVLVDGRQRARWVGVRGQTSAAPTRAGVFSYA